MRRCPDHLIKSLFSTLSLPSLIIISECIKNVLMYQKENCSCSQGQREMQGKSNRKTDFTLTGANFYLPTLTMKYSSLLLIPFPIPFLMNGTDTFNRNDICPCPQQVSPFGPTQGVRSAFCLEKDKQAQSDPKESSGTSLC